MENWINICEFDQKAKGTMEWLFKLLEEEKIEYKIKLKDTWEGIGKNARRRTYVLVFVQKDYKEKVESYIKEYNNPRNIVYEEAEELRNAHIDEEEDGEYKLSSISRKVIFGIFIGMMSVVIIGLIINSL